MKVPRSSLRVVCLLFGISGFSISFAEVPAWRIDYQKSTVNFIAEQAGAMFEGRWDEWNAEVRFDPMNLADSYAVAHFYVSSVATFDTERDATLGDPEWFDAKAHPVATFEATRFKLKAEGGFEAASELEVKGLRTPLTFYFRVEEGPDGTQVLKGETEIDRLAARIGTGEWLDTKWIGQFVRVEVILYATIHEASAN